MHDYFPLKSIRNYLLLYNNPEYCIDLIMEQGSDGWIQNKNIVIGC